MNSIDFNLECSQCHRKVGVATAIGGTMNIVSLQICCISCLPQRLKQLESEGFNQAAIDSARKWMGKVRK